MSTVQTQDLMPVSSRVSWSAIFAGAVIALTVNLVLSMLGVALGLTLSDRVDGDNLGTAAATWAVASALIALFVGGFVVSQCTVGENRGEAVIYGVIHWGVVFAMLMWMVAGGVRMGFSAVMGSATAASAAGAHRMTEEDLRSAGFTDEQIANFRSQFDQLRNRGQNAGEEARQAVHDPRTTSAAWWSVLGVILSMFASVGGALMGAGPTLYLAGIGVRSSMAGVSYRGGAAGTRTEANR